MHEIRSDAEGGVNAFIENQAKEPGEALLTLVQFNSQYEFLHRGLPIVAMPKYELIPHGGTALLVEDCSARGRRVNNLFWGAVRVPSAANEGAHVPVGYAWEGHNMLGRLWMEERAMLQALIS